MGEQTSKAGDEILRGIRGAKLSSVQFVLNYLILGFDEKGALTTLVWPEVMKDGAVFRFSATGYRDTLCALIAQVVDDTHISNDETIQITFRDESRIQIPLRSYEGAGERAIFTGPKHVLFAW